MLTFAHFLGERGGLPDSKDDEEHFLLSLGDFSNKIWEDDKSPNTLTNLRSYRIRFLKCSWKESKNRGGIGVKAFWAWTLFREGGGEDQSPKKKNIYIFCFALAIFQEKWRGMTKSPT